MKLTYFKLPHQTDSNCYSIRKQTKKAVIKELAELLIEDKVKDSTHWRDAYGETRYVKDSSIVTTVFTIHKIVIEYNNSFDLMDQLINGEDGAEYPLKEYTYTRSDIFRFVRDWARKGETSI